MSKDHISYIMSIRGTDIESVPLSLETLDCHSLQEAHISFVRSEHVPEHEDFKYIDVDFEQAL